MQHHNQYFRQTIDFDILRATSSANRQIRWHISILRRPYDRSLASIRGYRERDLIQRDISARLYDELCELVRICILSFERERTLAPMLESLNQ